MKESPGLILFPHKIIPPKDSKLVILIILHQVLSGINHGVFSILPKFQRLLADLASVGIFIFLWIDVCLSVEHDWFLMGYLIYYNVVFILLRCSKYTILDFLNELTEIDRKWKLKVTSFYVDFKIWSSLAVSYTVSIFMVVYFCEESSCKHGRTTMGHWGSNLLKHTLNSLSVTQAWYFYHVYARIKVLKNSLQGNEIGIREAKMIFKTVADCLDKIRAVHDGVLALGFIVSVVRCINILWTLLLFFKSDEISTLKMLVVLYALYWTWIICLPGVVCEMTAVAVGELKMVVNNRLRFKTYGVDSEEWVHFLEYVSARAPLRPAWRLVPVNLRQQLSMCSISVTYLIVLLQFTHTY